MKYKINEVSKLTGVTVRTLHYYDEIGLLKPSEVTESNYRLYDETALQSLQEILFYRELEFQLSEIKEIMASPSYDRDFALKQHKDLLQKKRDRLDGLIHLVDQTIKGEMKMNFKPFDMSEIEATKQKYAKEAKERWGNTAAYQESEKRTKNYKAEEWQMINEESGVIFKAFHEDKANDAAGENAQKLVASWQAYITKYFYPCTNEILAGLGLMYIHDERFKENIDQYGEGTAEFMSRAIEVYCSK